MDPSEFDRLIARAQDPRLIPGIYNYCDSRCHRCPFHDRCLTCLEDRKMEAQATNRTDTTIVDMVGASLRRSLDVITEAARRTGIDLDAFADIGQDESTDADPDRHRQDPLAVQAREYGHLAWRITNALGPVVEARGDPLVIDAVETIGWFSSLISAKIFRAVFGLAESSEADEEDIQTDYDGSAKVALIGIAESRAAWEVLMEHGKAAADGVPAQAVRMLGALEEAVRARFPLALEFVRPGFDEPDVAAGARATLPPFARRRRV